MVDWLIDLCIDLPIILPSVFVLAMWMAWLVDVWANVGPTCCCQSSLICQRWSQCGPETILVHIFSPRGTEYGPLVTSRWTQDGPRWSKRKAKLSYVLLDPKIRFVGAYGSLLLQRSTDQDGYEWKYYFVWCLLLVLDWVRGGAAQYPLEVLLDFFAKCWSQIARSLGTSLSRVVGM